MCPSSSSRVVDMTRVPCVSSQASSDNALILSHSKKVSRSIARLEGLRATSFQDLPVRLLSVPVLLITIAKCLAITERWFW